MRDWEIEMICSDIACRYDLTFPEYNEMLHSALTEVKMVREYYES